LSELTPTSGQDRPQAGYAAPRKPRWGLLASIGLLHLVVLAGLIRALAPDFAAQALDETASLASVTVVTREPETPPPERAPAPDAGAAGEEGKRSVARAVTAPEAPLPRPSLAPQAASTGAAQSSGAEQQGQGTGAGGQGAGTGSGGAGVGQGGGARPLQLIAGSIDDSRDYPTPPGGRQMRRGHDVVIELTVGTDGRVKACRVTDPSPDPEADAITCRLATERFVFRPRLDDGGNPVTGIYRWRQRWF
jgi:protein TonB